ncbi:MgtC/SapB family protein [Metabacillus sp. KIGAM252]|uniref:MgtC/SapB family protein n=2 Tax=Metabacillus flavus TaxID=2823519 RepID=A0ABS5L996_9BACI|nr:MgtC/SapB family protein [Metabacillus flavus]
MMARIIFTAFLCGFIGAERELKGHPAGFRTHLIVGIGACLLMLLSLYGFEDYLEEYPSTQFDPSRIPSYVISGIGFLGAGTILVKGSSIHGLTTAASIWISAGLGLVIGAGMYMLACFTAIVVVMSLSLLNRVQWSFNKKKERERMKIKVQPEESLEEVLRALEHNDLVVYKMSINNSGNDQNEPVYILEVSKKDDWDS